MSEPMTFTAYVDGPDMARAVHARLMELCASRDVAGEVHVVDVSVTPHAAEEGNIVGIPTVVREDPRPRRRVIGALDDTRRVADALGLDDRRAEHESAGAVDGQADFHRTAWLDGTRPPGGGQ